MFKASVDMDSTYLLKSINQSLTGPPVRQPACCAGLYELELLQAVTLLDTLEDGVVPGGVVEQLPNSYQDTVNSVNSRKVLDQMLHT